MRNQFAYPTINLKKTGENLKRIRKEKGVTVAQICEAMGFENPQSVYKWQRGMTLPNVDNLFALSKLLEVTIEDLLVEEEPMTTQNHFKDLLDAGPFPFVEVLRIKYERQIVVLTCKVTNDQNSLVVV